MNYPIYNVSQCYYRKYNIIKSKSVFGEYVTVQARPDKDITYNLLSIEREF